MVDHSIIHISWRTLFDEEICKSAAHAVLQILLSDPKMTKMNGSRIFWRPVSWKEACWRTNKVSSQEEDKGLKEFFKSSL
jgi:hypothetical protein